MAKQMLAQALRQAIESAKARGQIGIAQIPTFTVERPPQEEFGDFSSNAALMIYKITKDNPRRIAQVLLEHLRLPEDLVEKVEVAGAGFINFYLKPNWLWETVRTAVREGEAWGRSDDGKGKKVQVEFVSANPYGPVHIGNARGGVIGDVVARLLEAVGFQVEREFYINDATYSTQLQKFGQSLEARYIQLLGHDVQMPKDGYKGQYVIDIAQEIVTEQGDRYATMPSEERAAIFTQLALERMVKRQKEALERFNIRFDNWVSERWLQESGRVQQTLERLRASGLTYEQDGALWLKASEFGDYKDEVLVRSTGAPTYLAGDIAYHAYKFERDYDLMIDVWGADHHGHVTRMKAALKAAGLDDSKLTVLLYQFVRLLRGGEPVAMGKREGELVTLEELMDWVGTDAARYFLLMRSADTHLDFDLDLAVKQSSENPVYYLQYAHARCCSIFKQAREQQHDALHQCKMQNAKCKINLSLLTHPSELKLMREIADFPEEVRQAALSFEPHRLTSYAQRLATAFHSGFYNDCRVLSDDVPLSAARLMLTEATRVTVRNLLNLMGISAPEQM